MNLIDVNSQFATDEQCLAYLEEMRWPDGVVRCTVCGCDRVSRITRRSASKNKRAQVFQCLEPTCKQQFSATSGTIFADSHLPLHKWFLAMALVLEAKKGKSAKQLQEQLGIGSYRTAWYMAHRIRKAMGTDHADLPKMRGTVEIRSHQSLARLLLHWRHRGSPHQHCGIGLLTLQARAEWQLSHSVDKASAPLPVRV
jgi:hypothetical protein